MEAITKYVPAMPAEFANNAKTFLAIFIVGFIIDVIMHALVVGGKLTCLTQYYEALQLGPQMTKKPASFVIGGLLGGLLGVVALFLAIVLVIIYIKYIQRAPTF
jgi:hypothetical protein